MTALELGRPGAAIADGHRADGMYDAALRAVHRGLPAPHLEVSYRDETWPLPLGTWCGAADPVDRAALDRLTAALPPPGDVLDVGCGPGRHAAALDAQGGRVVGVDTSLAATALTRGRGVEALHADVFEPLPDDQQGWDGVLLLDGNIGIGGDPVRLLGRARRLLRPGGTVLVELDPARPTDRGQARLRLGGRLSRPFPWARLAPADLAASAAAADLRVQEQWSAHRRAFALLGPAGPTS